MFALARSLMCLIVLASAFLPAANAQSIPAPVLQALASMVPSTAPDSISPAPVAGFYEIVFGPRVVYVSSDGQHLLMGDIINVQTRVNLTDVERARARVSALDRIGEDSMIVFGPENADHTVSIFTDVSCFYCAKLHAEMAKYNRLGIRVRYLAFPRAGAGSDAYQTMESVWCSDDQRSAMTDAKADRAVQQRKCTNPVSDHFTMGRLFGVTGTPTIVLDSGELVTGYLPPNDLLARLRGG